jgi:hypothetical protein
MAHVFSFESAFRARFGQPALNGEEAVQITAEYAPRDRFSALIVNKTSV